MRSFDETRKRWTAVFCDEGDLRSPTDLREALKAEQGNTCGDGLRSICWKAFLLFDDLDRAQWAQKTDDSRSAYSALREHFLKYIEHPDDIPSTTDPLADDDESPWQTLRQDEQRRADITQDVDRCLQENYFFREPATKAKMVDVLFIYVKLNPDLGYRQGMHELLAPILWVVDRDAIEPKSVEKDTPGEDDDLMRRLLDARYVEHDSFTLFCAVMQTARAYYEHGEHRSSSGTMDVIPIVNRCQYIHQELLATTDLELADHLHAVEILPQIFLTRWMRLLFGREFPFEDVLVMWDHLFAEGLRPELVDFVCIAMLLRIRWTLLQADCSGALTLLLRYPSPQPYALQSFVYDAIYLEQNPTTDRGNFLISKYSGKPPNSSNHPGHTGRRAQQLGDWNDISDGGSPVKSPLKNGTKNLETIFQDVSEGIQRRTESWGVARAVRGAVSEARRNMQQSIPSDSSSSAFSSSHSRIAPRPADDHRSSTRVNELEERNRALAKSLNSVLDDLRSQTPSINAALTKVQSVQTCLKDSSAPLPSFTHSQSAKPVKPATPTATAKPPVTVAAALSNGSSASANKEPPKSLPVKPANLKPKQPPPSRRPQRASLADSEFSWMLGGDRNSRSSFVSSASVPPEQARHHTSQALFGGIPEDEGPRRPRMPSTSSPDPDELAMHSLRGDKGVSSDH